MKLGLRKLTAFFARHFARKRGAPVSTTRANVPSRTPTAVAVEKATAQAKEGLGLKVTSPDTGKQLARTQPIKAPAALTLKRNAHDPSGLTRTNSQGKQVPGPAANTAPDSDTQILALKAALQAQQEAAQKKAEELAAAEKLKAPWVPRKPTGNTTLIVAANLPARPDPNKDWFAQLQEAQENQKGKY